MEKRRVLFLCTGNSARSQMAEGLVNHYLGDTWEAVSAGTRPAGQVQPNAVAALALLGIDISGARSKSVDEFRAAPFDLIITVCDSAAEECPVWLGAGRRVHLGFTDPAGQPLQEFVRVRDEMIDQILPYLKQLAASPQQPVKHKSGQDDGRAENPN